MYDEEDEEIYEGTAGHFFEASWGPRTVALIPRLPVSDPTPVSL